MHCYAKVLIVSSDQAIIGILKDILKEKNINVEITSQISCITSEYCVVVVGPDVPHEHVTQRIRELPGILPKFLFLVNENNYTPFYGVSCKCRRLLLPMEIFYIEEYLDSMLQVPYYS